LAESSNFILLVYEIIRDKYSRLALKTIEMSFLGRAANKVEAQNLLKANLSAMGHSLGKIIS